MSLFVKKQIVVSREGRALGEATSGGGVGLSHAVDVRSAKTLSVFSIV